MAEDKIVADAPAVEPAEDTKGTKTEQPKLDSNRPLSQQVDKILKAMPEEEKKEDEPAKPEEKPKSEEEKPGEEPEASKLPTPDEDDEEEPYIEPKELPTWQKYILDNLPNIQVIGHVGDKKDKVYDVKRIEDLPDDFEFSSKRAELAFNAAVASQEVNARELLAKYNQEEQQQKYQEFQNQEALNIQADIKTLQKEGVLGKFEFDEDDPKFNDDPAVKEANAIYDIYKKRNDAYLKQFNQTGQTYRVSFRDAADIYYAQVNRNRPNKPDAKPENKAEREKIAEKQSGNQGANPENVRRKLVPGMTMQDIYQAYKRGVI